VHNQNYQYEGRFHSLDVGGCWNNRWKTMIESKCQPFPFSTRTCVKILLNDNLSVFEFYDLPNSNKFLRLNSSKLFFKKKVK
jgi:hypothetical protein